MEQVLTLTHTGVWSWKIWQVCLITLMNFYNPLGCVCCVRLFQFPCWLTGLLSVELVIVVISPFSMTHQNVYHERSQHCNTIGVNFTWLWGKCKDFANDKSDIILRLLHKCERWLLLSVIISLLSCSDTKGQSGTGLNVAHRTACGLITEVQQVVNDTAFTASLLSRCNPSEDQLNQQRPYPNIAHFQDE